MQAPTTSPATFQTTPARNGNPRVIAAVAVVLALHAALFGFALSMRDRPLPRPIEAKAITAMLISETPKPAPQQVAIETPPQPQPKPIPKPIPKPKVKPKVEPKPTPMPVTEKPSQIAAPAPDPTPPAPTPVQPAPPAAPVAAAEKPSMQISAPKNVPTVKCNVPQPEYPRMSQRRGESGRSLVLITLGLSGKIEDARLQKSSGYSRLDDAALAAAHEISCVPYVENGAAIRVTHVQPYDFLPAE
jgi:periplasmic protein TonB